jgi:hypothetical protein
MPGDRRQVVADGSAVAMPPSVVRQAVYVGAPGCSMRFVYCINADGTKDEWATFRRVDGGPWVAEPRRLSA